MIVDRSSPISSLVPVLQSAQGSDTGPRQIRLTGTNATPMLTSPHGNSKSGPRFPTLGRSLCGNSGRPLGLPLGTLHWRGPGLVPVSHLGEDQFLVAWGGLHYRTNELIDEDGNVINRLAPV